jgi:peroxiredoxin
VQLRQDYAGFTGRGAEIIAIGPDGSNAFRRYWSKNQIPFPGCADVGSRVADHYYQEFNLLKLGRMPALFIIDRSNQVRFAHYGDSMSDIPANSVILDILENLNQEIVAEAQS